MKKVVLLLLLAGCSASVTENAAESAKDTVSAMVTVLPKECQTESVKALEQVAKKEIDNVVYSCTAEKKELKYKLAYLKIALIALITAVLWLVKKSFF